MLTTFHPYAANQDLLLPTSLRKWLPEDHLAYFISDAVDTLNLSAFYVRYEGDGRRRAPFEPVMMVKILVYAYATGVFSSRKMAQKLTEDVAFRVLGANNFPAHRTLLMAPVGRRVKDKRVLRLIRRYLQAGILEGGVVSPRTEGTPQGGPLSPLFSNLLIDEWDK